jgi:hypothetical protein
MIQGWIMRKRLLVAWVLLRLHFYLEDGSSMFSRMIVGSLFGCISLYHRKYYPSNETDRLTVGRKLTSTSSSTLVVQWLRLVLSKGPSRVDVSLHLKTEIDKVSETLCFKLI